MKQISDKSRSAALKGSEGDEAKDEKMDSELQTAGGEEHDLQIGKEMIHFYYKIAINCS